MLGPVSVLLHLLACHVLFKSLAHCHLLRQAHLEELLLHLRFWMGKSESRGEGPQEALGLNRLGERPGQARSPAADPTSGP